MFDAAVPAHTRDTLVTLATQQLLPPQSYLAGGTALALQLGHRMSYDLDLFTSIEFEVSIAAGQLGKLPHFALQSTAIDTVHGSVGETHVSLFCYRYPLVDPTIDYHGVPLAGLRDIAAMKLWAIGQRAVRRDYVDLAALIEHYPLPELLDLFDEKFGRLAGARVHIVKSLIYFEEANRDDHPKTLVDGLDWEAVKAKLITAVRALDTYSRE